MLEVEIMLPAGVEAKPASGSDDDTFLELGSVTNHVQRQSKRGELRFSEARREGGRWIVPGSVLLFTGRGHRSISFQMAGVPATGFLVPLPKRPSREHETWSEWGPQPRAPHPPWPDTKPSYRFRIQRIAPPPPQPTMAEIEAAEAREEQAEFEAVSPDAPISDWLRYTRYGTDEARLKVAVGHIASRASLVAELAPLMVAEDSELASDALRLLAHLPKPTPALVAPVREAGRDVAERIRRFNATTPETDPHYEGAADVSIRFSAWMEAVRALRDPCHADLTPELGEILALSRLRTDSHCLQADVRRVASYYMHQWAGLAPLPGDPPPR
jgi:hypothetical protein